MSKLSRAAATKGLTWPLPEVLDEAALEALVYGAVSLRSLPARKREPDYSLMQQTLKRKEITLQLLWEEYTEATAEAVRYCYSQYCHRYRDWLKQQPLSMRQTHLPGDKWFVDYAGVSLPIVDPNTGEVHPAQVFIAVRCIGQFLNREFVQDSRTDTPLPAS